MKDADGKMLTTETEQLEWLCQYVQIVFNTTKQAQNLAREIEDLASAEPDVRIPEVPSMKEETIDVIAF